MVNNSVSPDVAQPSTKESNASHQDTNRRTRAPKTRAASKRPTKYRRFGYIFTRTRNAYLERRLGAQASGRQLGPPASGRESKKEGTPISSAAHPAMRPTRAGGTPALPVARLMPTSLLALLCLLLSGPAAAADTPNPPSSVAPATLLVEPARDRIEWGRTLNVRVTMTDPRRHLEQLDLSTWREHFDITVGDVNQVEKPRWPGWEVQQLRLRLHPLGNGRFTLPALRLSGAIAEPFTLTVDPPSVSGSPLQPRLSVSSRQPWERQQVLIRLTLTTPDQAASLGVDQTPSFPGFEVFSLPSIREPVADGYLLGIGWALFPLVGGDYRLKLPTIDYRISGGARYAWHLPEQAITVRALPAYLPPTLPVGRIRINGRLQPQDILRPGELAWWKLELSGPLPGTWLPPLPSLHRENTATELLRPQIQTSTDLAFDGITGRQSLQLPFKPLGSGRLRLPEPVLIWFNPDAGRLMRLQLSAPSRWVIATHWMVVAGLLAGIVILALLTLGTRRLITWLRRQRAHRRALLTLRSANNAAQIRQALNRIAVAHGWPDQLSLRDWGETWSHHYRIPPAWPGPLARLSAACYGPNATAIPALRDDLVSALRRPRSARSRPLVEHRVTTDSR